MAREPFSAKLRYFRESANRSRNQLGRDVGVDPSYLTRLEHGDRDAPGRHIVEAIGREVCPDPAARDDLLIAAGYAPAALMDCWGPTVRGLVDVLQNDELTEYELEDFEQTVGSIIRRWLLPIRLAAVRRNTSL